jgi:hypothetical protein
MEPNVRSVHPKEALAAYAEPWIGEGRVAVFGNATYGLGSRLADLGASVVELWDPDEIRARAEAERSPDGVTVQFYSSARALPRRTLDLAIVPDLGLFDDAADLVARLRDMVGTRGIVLLAATNRDAPGHRDARAFDYYELFDLVAAEFAEVRMIAEVPFHGVAMVRLGDDEEPHAVSVDTQLAPTDRTADAFVVVAAQWPATFDAYTILELGEGAARGDGARNVDALKAELRLRTDEGERAAARSAELESTLRDQSTRIVELEAALVERARHLSELSAEVEEKRAAAEAGRVAAADMEQVAHRADRADRRTSELERELAKAADTHAQEVARFEEALRDRGRAVKDLEREVGRQTKMVRELVATLEETQENGAETVGSPPPAPADGPVPEPAAAEVDKAISEENARLREQLNRMALDIARREGEAQAAAWTVAELERRLAQVGFPAPLEG